ncbi:DUF3742 family protein [Pseudomonas sp. NPDC088368]|uniref:DUF3742 family protein n=1 Tax=Pseudomonas sp. NPDC088368 TaxID=3364453 RepID=UPI0037F4B4DA
MDELIGAFYTTAVWRNFKSFTAEVLKVSSVRSITDIRTTSFQMHGEVPMVTQAGNRDSFAMRLGQSLGRGVGRILRVERSAWGSLYRAGVPSALVFLMKWLTRALVIGGGAYYAALGLLYALSVAVFVAIIVGLLANPDFERAARGSQLVHSSNDERKAFVAELRDGLDGYGTYIGSQRID